MRNIDEIKKYILRQAKGNIYYFNDNGIYCKITVDEAKKMRFSNLNIREDETIWIDYFFLGLYIHPNLVIAKKAITNLKVGDTIENFKEKIKNTKLDTHHKPEGLDRFITKIEKPYFVKKPENCDKNIFDYIYIDLCIVHEWNEDKREYIKEHMKGIKNMMIDKLEADTTFKRFGVPINFLRISRLTLKNNDVLQFVLELKEI